MTDEPTYISGNDIPVGSEVKWYHGGILRSEERLVTANEAANGLLLLAHPAEYGSVVGTVNGTPTLLKQLTPTDAPATDATGTGAVAYSGMRSGDRLSIDYLDTKSAPQASRPAPVSLPGLSSIREEAVDGRLQASPDGDRNPDGNTRKFCTPTPSGRLLRDLLVSETDGSLWTDEYQTKNCPGDCEGCRTARCGRNTSSCPASLRPRPRRWRQTYYTNRFDLLVENPDSHAGRSW